MSVFIRVRDEGKSCEYSHSCYFSFSTHLGAIFMSCNRIFSPGKSKLCESRLDSLPSLLEKPRINNRLLALTFPSSQWVDLSSPLQSYCVTVLPALQAPKNSTAGCSLSCPCVFLSPSVPSSVYPLFSPLTPTPFLPTFQVQSQTLLIP